jgi:toxin ParE1/3/4
MRPEPALTPDAHADVQHAALQYEAQSLSLGGDFLDEFQRSSALIREAPLLSTLVDAPIRRVLLHRFPYGVFFVAGSDDSPDVIVAVVDLRQDPDAIRRAYLR